MADEHEITQEQKYPDPPVLLPGMRVRLLFKPTAVTLRGREGTVKGHDQWDDYVIVQLDEPALYHHADGTTEPLSCIRVMIDNLEVLSRPV